MTLPKYILFNCWWWLSEAMTM